MTPVKCQSVTRSLLLFLLLPCIAMSAYAETNWVSDSLFVPLRSGPSSQHRIVHRGLKSGTAVTVVSRDDNAGYAKVRTEKGVEGYMSMQYLSREPIAALKLVTAEKKIARLMATRNPMQKQLSELETANSELENARTTLSTEKEMLQKELDEIRKISANTISIDKRNRELLEQNRELKNEIDQLNIENTRLEDSSDREWFKLGAGAIILGVIIGFVLPFFKPRKKAQTGWN